MPSFVGGLTRDQFFAVEAETTSAKNNLWDGRQALRRMRNVDLERDGVLNSLALGAERLAKVSLMLVQFRDLGRWDIERWKHHRLDDLDMDLQQALRENVQFGTHPPYLTQLLDELAADEIWPQLRHVLHEYGTNGRYHHLDSLTVANMNSRVSPAELWSDLELEISRSLPHMSQPMTPENWESMLAEVNRVLVASLDRWWELVSRFWAHGSLGDVAKSFSGTINLNLLRMYEERR